VEKTQLYPFGRYDGLWKLLTCDRQTPGIERRTALTQRRAVKIKYKDKLFISNGQLTKLKIFKLLSN